MTTIHASIVIDPTFKHQVRWAQAMGAGFRQHGVSLEIQSHEQGYRECDVIVTWGTHHKGLFEFRDATGQEILVLERGYLGDRFNYTAVGWNGLNGRADFCAENSPEDRFQSLRVELRPWRASEQGEYGLVLGQVRGDSSHRHVTLEHRLQSAVQRLKSWSDLPVIYRSHPCGGDSLPGVTTAAEASLAEHLDRAAFALTFNSNSAVEAIIAGVPTITLDEGAMAYSVTDHDAARAPRTHDRGSWINNLAYCQWSLEEIQSGDAWMHVRQRIA